VLKLGVKKEITVRNVLNLTLIPLLNVSLHTWEFSRPPTYVLWLKS
jgi:hypothetical protein